MRYKAVFFDRDGTLTHANPAKTAWRDGQIALWSGKPFSLSYEKTMALFDEASEGRQPWYHDVADEKEFFRRYYRRLLLGEGVTEETDARAELLLRELWMNGEKILYPEVRSVLEAFRDMGCCMGVISDTSPSLQLSIEALGIGAFFSSYTASSLVGADKPSPVIFNAALRSLDVAAEECLYVDDYKPEADGAREQGFTAFLIDRNGAESGRWVIRSLREMVEFARS